MFKLLRPYILTLTLTVLASSAASAQMVYVGNADGSVSVVRHYHTIGNFPVSPNIGNIGLSPDGTIGYVTEAYPTGGLAVLDLATNTVAGTLTFGVRPDAITFSYDSHYAYIADLVSDQVFILDNTTETLVGDPIDLTTFSAIDIAVTRDGRYLYVVSQCGMTQFCGQEPPTPGTVSIIDLSLSPPQVVKILLVGYFPESIAMGSSRALVANGCGDATCTQNGSVSVINLQTQAVTKTVQINDEYFSQYVVLNRTGTAAYISSACGNEPPPCDDAIGNVSVLDLATNTVTATIPVGINPQELRLTQDGKSVYVAIADNRHLGSNLAVIDTTTNTVIKTVNLGEHHPFFLAIKYK